MSITPPSPSPPPRADFKTDPTWAPNSPSQRPTYPRTSPPARPETPPTPELTFASIFTSHNLPEVKAPPPLDLPDSLPLPPYPSPTPTHSESNHGSPVVSPYAISSFSLSSRSFESVSLRSLSSEALSRDDNDDLTQPPAPAFLREHNGVGLYTQGRMMWRPMPTTYVPYPPWGAGLPFAIIEEEEPPEEASDHDQEESYYSAESGSMSSQEQEQEKEKEKVESKPTTSRECWSEESGSDHKKEKKRRSLRKCIKRMFVEKREAFRQGLKV